MARPDLTRALDALFHAAGDVRAAAADMRAVTPAEYRQQRQLLALAGRIRSDVARIGNERHEAAKVVSSSDTLGAANLPVGQVSSASLAEAA